MPLVRSEHRSKRYPVPALEKGLDILEHLSDQAIPLTQAELARALGRQPGELFRMLSALEDRGYIRRDQATSGYALTLKLFEISRTHSPYETLLCVATPLMRRLADETGETCHLSTLNRGGVLVLAQEESPKPIRLSVEVGSRHPLTTTTSGRLLLSAMSEAERREALARCPIHTQWSPEQRRGLTERIEVIAHRGHELSEGERFLGSLDFGMLVGDERTQIKAVLIIATLRHEHGPDKEELLAALKGYVDLIAEEAGLRRTETT